MNPFSPRFSPRRIICWVLVGAIATGVLRAAEKDEPVAVFAQVFNGYKRTRLPDKSFKPETYTFGEGGSWTRPVKDAAMEQMTFPRVAHAVAAPLARLNFVPSAKAAGTDLLILVFWGTTEGSRDADRGDATGQAASALARVNNLAAPGPPSDEARVASADADFALAQLSLANADRDALDARNARILGYSEVLDRARSAAHMSFAQDILAEIGHNRYYVVLQAYDFKTAQAEKKLKPLWTARLSMDEAGNNFARSLEQMLAKAGRYLGQDSNGLLREVTPEGRVEIGPTKVVEPPPEK